MYNNGEALCCQTIILSQINNDSNLSNVPFATILNSIFSVVFFACSFSN